MKPVDDTLKKYTIGCLYAAIRDLKRQLAVGIVPPPYKGLCFYCYEENFPYRNLCLELTEQRFGGRIFLDDWLVRKGHITTDQYHVMRYSRPMTRKSKGLLRKLARTRILLAYDLIREIKQMEDESRVAV